MDYKMYILVNEDIKIGKGKLAGQVGHAVASYFNKFVEGLTDEVDKMWVRFLQSMPFLPRMDVNYSVVELERLREYMNTAQKKIILKCPQATLESLDESKYIFIRDNGLTQLEPNTLTCVNIGILTEDEVPEWIKELKLV